MNNEPNSFIICNISIQFPKRRIFDIFQQKKLCIIESIEFILQEESNSDICYASVYVAKWYSGKVSSRFVENLQTTHYVEIIDCNNYIWKIISTPHILRSAPKWYQTHHNTNRNNNRDDLSSVVVKIKSKPIPYASETGTCTSTPTNDTDNDYDDDYNDSDDDDSVFAESESDYADFELLCITK